MPRQPNLQVVISPVNGLVTDASPLTFPENAFVDGYDIIVDQKGKLTRRKGFEYESGYTLNTFTHSSSGVEQTFEWGSVAGDGDVNFLVIQAGVNIFYYLLPTNGSAVSANKKSFSTDLNNYKVTGTTNLQSDRAQFASGNGVLVIVHPKCSPIIIEYDVDADTITETPVQLEIRDFEGIEDNLDIDERPATLSDEHHYNLDNQGWGQDIVNHSNATQDAITYWDAQRTDFPANIDIWWYYKDSNERMDLTSTASGMGPEKFSLGNTPAPKGHFILDPFYEDRSAVSGVGSFTVVETDRRPSTAAFYAGRVFYSGVNDTGWNNNIYYSQLIINDDEYGKCYQANDPTSENLSDLLDTDGGVVKIPEAGTVVKLHPVGPYLLVFATNGIWAISGPDQNVFKATDFAINKITDETVIGTDSIVSVQGTPYWWNTNGIHRLSFESTLGTLQVEELSHQKIDDFFDTIPPSEIAYVSGTYNPRTEVITWLYRSTASSTVAGRYEYDRALNFNRLTNAFYPWTISQPADGPKVVGIFTNRLVTSADTKTYYMTKVPFQGSTYYHTVSEQWDTDLLDWTTFDSTGTDYSSYCTLGYALAGSGFLDFASNYLVFLLETETNASCIARGIWSYATSPDSGKYSVGQQIYPAKSNVGYQESRLKIRGEGRSLQVKFESETGKPFTIIGFIVFVTGNQGP